MDITPQQEYLYIAWNSETTTRSGYQARPLGRPLPALHRVAAWPLRGGCGAGALDGSACLHADASAAGQPPTPQLAAPPRAAR